jgi:hypothetical protein
MIETPTAVSAASTADGRGRLHNLVGRIAVGDRPAFRCLYAFLVMGVWRAAIRELPRPVDAQAVTRATFVEVWYLARHHVDQSHDDASAWITAITARHVGERRRAPTASGGLLGDYDCHVHRELASLLGAGHATIRTGPASFIRVADLDLDLGATLGQARVLPSPAL